MSAAPNTPNEDLFANREPERQPVNPLPWVIAGVVVLLAIAAVLITNHRKPVSSPGALLALDPYADSIVFSGIELSEATSISGGKSTYIDGHIKNAGTKTVTGLTVQVLFANDVAMPPQVVTVPVTLVRTHEPYVDTQPVSDAPLAPGDNKEFRLIFEDVTKNWNQQKPEIRVVKVTSW